MFTAEWVKLTAFLTPEGLQSTWYPLQAVVTSTLGDATLRTEEQQFEQARNKSSERPFKGIVHTFIQSLAECLHQRQRSLVC